jgi:hypothetical protein
MEILVVAVWMPIDLKLNLNLTRNLNPWSNDKNKKNETKYPTHNSPLHPLHKYPTSTV